MTFYPFCVVFTLYAHVLACTNPDNCEGDIQALENIGAAMTDVSTQRPDFVPFAKTINALNRVSRTLQDERRRGAALAETKAPGHSAMDDPNIPWSSYDTFQDLVATERSHCPTIQTTLKATSNLLDSSGRWRRTSLRGIGNLTGGI
jgi:hypothetical protein